MNWKIFTPIVLNENNVIVIQFGLVGFPFFVWNLLCEGSVIRFDKNYLSEFLAPESVLEIYLLQYHELWTFAFILPLFSLLIMSNKNCLVFLNFCLLHFYWCVKVSGCFLKEKSIIFAHSCVLLGYCLSLLKLSKKSLYEWYINFDYNRIYNWIKNQIPYTG